MGHELPGMTGAYINHIPKDRLADVSACVRRWVFEEGEREDDGGEGGG